MAEDASDPCAAAGRLPQSYDGDADAEAGEDGGMDEGPEDAQTLRARWEKEAATVRLLARDGLLESHPTMRAAVAARDAAEKAYKQERSPHPVARRMGWAQAKLDRAFKQRDKTRAQLIAFDEEAAKGRQRIVDRLAADQARVGKHQQALEELQL